jgi:hypothetical protein
LFDFEVIATAAFQRANETEAAPVWATPAVHSRIRRGAGSCNGGQNKYMTYWNTDMSNAHASDAAICLQQLRYHSHGYVCHTETYRNCRCTLHNPFTSHDGEVFDAAYDNLRESTNNFWSIEAERHELNLYLTYTC